ncbi:MAG: polymerase [Acidobacteria bacterium]|nr:polymerase [Acidobacteriota bacterium]
MVELTQVREYMRAQSEEHRELNPVRTTGKSIEDALEQAAIELGVAIANLQYEVVQTGRTGILGSGAVEWAVVAYEVPHEEGAEFDDSLLDAIGPRKRPQVVHGEAMVRLSTDGVLLRVTQPENGGSRVGERGAYEALARRGIADYKQQMVGRVVKHADGTWVKVAEYDFDPASQAEISVEIGDDEMKATIRVSAPGPGGTDVSAAEILAYAEGLGVVHGILQDVLLDFETRPRYDEHIVIAQGERPVNGADAKIAYLFNVDRSTINLREKDGRVDFKELDLIENVEAGQILAKKVPAEEGESGRTVTGRELPASSGADIEITAGKNVRLAEDGQSALAEINGQVILQQKGVIVVEPIFVVSGDVNHKTGNILFLGTVLVKGNVEDGFDVKAAGDIEIRGSVGKCVIDAEGSITVYQGIQGKSGGRVHAGGDVLARFIEQGTVECDGNVVVSDGIVHSRVDAKQRIICDGKHAQIVGGHLRAAEAIQARVMGSINGTETTIEAGFDPQSMEALAEYRRQKDKVEAGLPDLDLNIKTLENLKQSRRGLTEEKEANLAKLIEKKAQLTADLNAANKGIAEINSHLETLGTRGRVSVAGQVHQGVKVFIKNGTPLAVRNEFKSVTFYLEGNDVKVTQYEAEEIPPKRS